MLVIRKKHGEGKKDVAAVVDKEQQDSKGAKFKNANGNRTRSKQYGLTYYCKKRNHTAIDFYLRKEGKQLW